jgi:general secretion pathway protein K
VKAQRGVALLATVLVVALATILIAGLLDRGVIGQARALQQTRAAQAVAFQQGLELWATRILRDDAERNLGAWSRVDAWAQPLPPLTLPEGMIEGRMRDLDGCLNLNSIVDAGGIGNPTGEAAKRFERLFRELGVDVNLVGAIVDWADADAFATSAGGAEDTVYASLDPPRRTANRPFVHVSELRAVAGIDADTYERLVPHVCARPIGTPININTASPQVLMSLHDGIGPALAQRLSNDGRAQFAGVEDFSRRLVDEAVPLPHNLIEVGTSSRHFVAEGDLLIGDVPVRLYSVLVRSDQNRYTVIARSQGRF